MGGAVARPKYMGEMLNGQRHGQGRMVWSDGRKYDGAFVKGAREGFGTLELANGDRYEGEWQYDQMHGKGKYTSEGINKICEALKVNSTLQHLR